MSDAPTPAATATRPVAAALLRHVLTAAGTALVARGYVDQDTIDNAIGPIADYVIGAGLALGAFGWSAVRAHIVHWRWVEAGANNAKSAAGP